MRGRLWLKNLFKALELSWNRNPHMEKSGKDSEWTQFMGEAMDEIAKNMNCVVVRRRDTPIGKTMEEMSHIELEGAYKNFERGIWQTSSERFNIDAVFINEAEYGLHVGGPKGIKYGPFALPEAVVELENSWDSDKICYCLWKVLCVRAPVHALICYQKNADMVSNLRQRLEDIVWGSSLMKGTDGDLLVVVGNEDKQNVSWQEYFTVFEWRRDSLEIVNGSLLK